MKTPKCCAKIWDDPWRKYRTCSRNAKIERDGKHYCGTHDPVFQAKAREEREAKWQAEMDEQARLYRLHSAAPDLLEALEAYIEALSDGPENLTSRRNDELEEKARTAINKAKGGDK